MAQNADAAPPVIVAFGPFEFDCVTHELKRDGKSTRFQAQPARVLAELIRARGAIVSREALRNAVWGQRFVDYEQGLNFCARQIRSVLADDAAAPVYLETVPKKGYRFIAPVRIVSPEPIAHPKRRLRWPWVAGSLSLLGVAAWITVSQERSQRAATLDPPSDPGAVAAAVTLSDSGRVRFLTAMSWMRATNAPDYGSAASLLDTVLMERPEFLPARIGRAEAWLWVGRTTDARRELDAILQVAPGDGRAQTLRGALALFRDWDLAVARGHLEAGVSLSPSSSVAHHYLAHFHLLAGDSAGAHREIERALALDPLSPTLSGDAGLIWYWLGDYAKADTLCARGARLDEALAGPRWCRFLIAAVRQDSTAMARTGAEVARLIGAPDHLRALLARSEGVRAFLEWNVARLNTVAESGPGTALDLARSYVLLGSPRAATTALEAGLRNHSNALPYARVDPILAPLRSDSAFQAILGRIDRHAEPVR